MATKQLEKKGSTHDNKDSKNCHQKRNYHWYHSQVEHTPVRYSWHSGPSWSFFTSNDGHLSLRRPFKAANLQLGVDTDAFIDI